MKDVRFNESWRRQKSRVFDLETNSTGLRTTLLDLWGQRSAVYANANFSVYSAQSCNAKCPFCVEELRPASRGRELLPQRTIEQDDGRYFAALEASLAETKPLNPTVSVTGGEASKDPRLPRILRTLAAAGARKRTLTTNGSGLFDVREDRRIIDWIAATGVKHLNISVAHYDAERNAKIMRYGDGLSHEKLAEAVAIAAAAGCRARLSCVLLDDAVHSLDEIRRYLDFAARLGVDNVIFRQLMKTDPRTSAPNFVVQYSDRRRVMLEPILDQISAAADFAFTRQIVGYYYYVEVWRRSGIDVVFEEADLAQLEDTKRRGDGVVHELIFHPNARLCSTWQPWDGVLGPRTEGADATKRLKTAPTAEPAL